MLEEPWVSIEGVLWDVKGGATSPQEGVEMIRKYLEVYGEELEEV